MSMRSRAGLRLIQGGAVQVPLTFLPSPDRAGKRPKRDHSDGRPLPSSYLKTPVFLEGPMRITQESIIPVVLTAMLMVATFFGLMVAVAWLFHI